MKFNTAFYDFMISEISDHVLEDLKKFIQSVHNWYIQCRIISHHASNHITN